MPKFNKPITPASKRRLHGITTFCSGLTSYERDTPLASDWRRITHDCNGNVIAVVSVNICSGNTAPTRAEVIAAFN